MQSKTRMADNKYTLNLQRYEILRFISVKYKKILFFLLVFFFQKYFSLNLSLNAEEIKSDIPIFAMKNQFEESIANSNIKKKNTILMGCYPEDWMLCKSLARKIYWLMQNHIYGKEDSYKFIAFINAQNLSKQDLIQIKSLLKNDRIEPLYFDSKGELKSGLRSKTMLLTTYNSSGKIIRKENISEMNAREVEKIFKEFIPHSEIDSKEVK